MKSNRSIVGRIDDKHVETHMVGRFPCRSGHSIDDEDTYWSRRVQDRRSRPMKGRIDESSRESYLRHLCERLVFGVPFLADLSPYSVLRTEG